MLCFSDVLSSLLFGTSARNRRKRHNMLSGCVAGNALAEPWSVENEIVDRNCKEPHGRRAWTDCRAILFDIGGFALLSL